MLRANIENYIKMWEQQGYSDGIPDEVPDGIAALNLAPSWRAIAMAILKNDHNLLTLGQVGVVSPWYGVLKRVEFLQSGRRAVQLRLPLRWKKNDAVG